MQSLNYGSAGANSAAGQYDISDAGCLVYVPGGIRPDDQNSLVRLDQKANMQPVIGYKAPFTAPRFSPDRQRIAYMTYGKEYRVWLHDLLRPSPIRMTRDRQAIGIAWTPSGTHLVFGRSDAGESNLFWQPVDGSSSMERLTRSENAQAPGSFNPDGSTLAFEEVRPDSNQDILLLDMKTRKVTPFLKSDAVEGSPEISPDGHWLAYVSNESGKMEVWVRPFPGPGGKCLISQEQGWDPVWSKDGKQLFYIHQTGQVWVVDVQTEGGFSRGKPRMAFQAPGFRVGNTIREWDLWPKGQGFLMIKMDEYKQPFVKEMILIQNWFEELKRLVPLK